MNGFEFGKCPWAMLDVPVNASPEDVRRAYRKLALRWHPDQNYGCSDAASRFHQIKDAFEEIQRRQDLSQKPRTSSYSPQSPNPSYQQETNASHYQRTARSSGRSQKTRKPFYGFRRDGQPRDQAPPRSSPFHDTYAGGTRSSRSNTFHFGPMRLSRTIAIGAGVVAATTVFMGLAISTDTVWHYTNRGKSFDDLMRNLDSGSSDSNSKKSTRRRNPRPLPRAATDSDTV